VVVLILLNQLETILLRDLKSGDQRSLHGVGDRALLLRPVALALLLPSTRRLVTEIDAAAGSALFGDEPQPRAGS